MSPADIARDLVARSDPTLIELGAREGVPVGLTYAALIPADTDDTDQQAIERANGKVMEGLLEGAREEAEFETVGGYLTVRVFDEGGEITPEALVAADAMASLEGYPVLDDMTLSEIEMELLESQWDEIDEGYKVYAGYESFTLDEDLPSGWKDELIDRYRAMAPGGRYDERGYELLDLDLIRSILGDRGWLEDEDEDDED